MKNFDKETMLAWTWAMEHPVMFTMIEILTSTPMVALALGFGTVKAVLSYKSKDRKVSR